MTLVNRIQHAWNVLTAKQPNSMAIGAGSSRPAHRTGGNYTTSSFAAAIFNRIAMDVSMTELHHVKVNELTDDRTPIKSGLHNCLNVEANIDQSGIQFVHDLVYSMFDDGVVAVVPVETTSDPTMNGTYNIETMRVGRITQWFPKYVTVKLYNDETGLEDEVTLPKSMVAIIENPLYAVVNGSNATLKRLLRKMTLMDDLDEMLASGRLDIIVHLPHAVRTEKQVQDAKTRIGVIEQQLATGRNGMAYMDATEKVTQLNRPANNQLVENVEMLAQQFYNQLGLTKAVFDGTAREADMRSYYNRTIDPIVDSIIAEFNRKFLTKTARTQGQTLESYRNMFKLVPIEQVAELGDTFRRNSIATSNEMRKIIGFKPSNDPKADELYNPNMPEDKQPDGALRLKQRPAEEDDIGSLTPPDNSSTNSQNE